jgi:hypothetical protein
VRKEKRQLPEEQIPEAWVGQAVYYIVMGMGKDSGVMGRIAPLVAVRDAGIVIREALGPELEVDAFYPWGNVVRLSLQPTEAPPGFFFPE